MKQDGKEVEEAVVGDRKVFFVDVGQMTPDEALRVINDIRERQGQRPVSTNTLALLFAVLAGITAGLYLLTLFNLI